MQIMRVQQLQVNKIALSPLRKKIREEEEVWLDNEELDTINDPDNHYIDDVYLRTVLNLGAEVMIGRSIYKITDEGTNWEITDGDVSALEMIRNGQYDEAEALENVIAHYRGQALHSACKTWKADAAYKLYGNNKKLYKKYICVRNYMWAHYVKAKTKSYKKRGNRWKNYYTTVKAKVYGKIWGPGYLGEVCSWQHNFSGPYKSRYHRWVKSKQPFGARTWAKTGTVVSWNKASYSSSYFSMTW